MTVSLGGHIDTAISVEIAFAQANRSFISLYKSLLLRETKFKMAQAICCGGIFWFPGALPLSPSLSLSLLSLIFWLHKVTALYSILKFQVD